MFVLGIESSCDETAAAVVGPGGVVLSDVVHSQVAMHRVYGGVVPELASRRHLEKIGPVVDEALERAGVSLPDLQGIAVTCTPGLVGGLLVGVRFAEGLAASLGVPITGVHHLEGHLMAPFLGDLEEEYPFIGLLVSGGHTALYDVAAFGTYRLLGQTRDDAAGEAFDKVARLLGLPYPGGREIDQRARDGDPKAQRFPRGMLHKGGYDFSFAGLKTSVATHLASRDQTPQGREMNDVCASFQEAVVDVLVAKTMRAAAALGYERILLCGGVAANSRLRGKLAAAATEAGRSLLLPEHRYCMDNGAMIAYLGRRQLLAGRVVPPSVRSRTAL